MNRILYISICAALAAILAVSCAKTETSGKNDANRRYLEAWMKINHPEAVKNASGIYILSDEEGTGREAGSYEDYPFAYLTYTVTDLDGHITETTDEDVAKQLGTYSEGSYYGPVIRMRSSNALTAGQDLVINSMHVGGTRKAVIPGWFNTTQVRYASEDDYFTNITGDDSVISVKLHNVISDITAWQLDSMVRYMVRNLHQLPDSLKYGFYYIQKQEPTDTTSFSSGSTVYINYSGMTLDGKVFDTTDPVAAKDAGIYNSGRDYSPMKINMASEYSDITFSTDSGTSSLIDGFAYCVSLMKTGEKGTCVFYSDLGYKSTSSGSIPAYSPLRFDIEMLGTNK